jgi:Tol biopolymer transport system component
VFSGDFTYLWLQDLRTNVISRFTFLPGKSPVWSPDGKSLVFARQDVISEIYRGAVTREGQEELLVNAGVNGRPFDWSSDGKWILYQRQEPQTGLDLWLWPVDGESKPVRYLQTPANETLATFSPDGRWIAYQSDESGQMQIYVQAMPANGVKYQISRGGGTRPQWRRDGKELFFISSDDKLVAVPMSLAARVEAGNPQALFSAVGIQDYTPSRDGQRFLMSEMDSREDAKARAITVTMNWMAGLNP